MLLLFCVILFKNICIDKEGNEMSLNKIEILGVPFVNTTQRQFVEQLDKHLENQEKVFVVTANPEIVMKAVEEEEYKTVIDKATYITADGIGVVKGSTTIK